MDEKGFSYVESCLALAVLLTIIALIIPLQLHLQRTLQFEMLQVHVTEVAMNGALLQKYYGETSGKLVIHQEVFEWHYDEGQVCVQYHWELEVTERCVSAF